MEESGSPNSIHEETQGRHDPESRSGTGKDRTRGGHTDDEDGDGRSGCPRNVVGTLEPEYNRREMAIL